MSRNRTVQQRLVRLCDSHWWASWIINKSIIRWTHCRKKEKTKRQGVWGVKRHRLRRSGDWLGEWVIHVQVYWMVLMVVWSCMHFEWVNLGSRLGPKLTHSEWLLYCIWPNKRLLQIHASDHLVDSSTIRNKRLVPNKCPGYTCVCVCTHVHILIHNKCGHMPRVQ